MKAAAVDASVWIAGLDFDDPFCAASRLFFSHAKAAGVVIHVPAFARVKVACALARKLRNAAKGERLANLVLKTAGAKEHPVSSALLAKAVSLGTAKFLRGADALYSATAELNGYDLVSWDKEHLKRARTDAGGLVNRQPIMGTKSRQGRDASIPPGQLHEHIF